MTPTLSPKRCRQSVGGKAFPLEVCQKAAGHLPPCSFDDADYAARMREAVRRRDRDEQEASGIPNYLWREMV